MGLTNWSGGAITKKDVSVAKNYLSKEELDDLNRVVTMYLDYAESQAKRKQAMTMQQWAEKLDAFLEFNDHTVLANAGKISQKIAKQLAEAEYDKFAEQRRVVKDSEPSDFDQFVEQAKRIGKANPDHQS